MCRDCLPEYLRRDVSRGCVRRVAGRPARLNSKAHKAAVVLLWSMTFLLAIPAICVGLLAYSIEGER